MSANLENSAVATNWKRTVLIPIPKKGNAKYCSNYHTILLISHASKIMLAKFSKIGFKHTRMEKFQRFKVNLQKAEEPELKLSTSVES